MSTAVNIVLGVVGAQGVISALDGIRSSLGGLASVALGTTSALAGVQSGLALGGEFNDLSARTGQSVRDLVVFRRALDNAGVGGANAAQYIGLLQKAIAGLNEEGNRTDDAFTRLGIDPQKLKNLGVSEQISALTAGFARIENPAERAALAMQLFGRSGAQMLQLIGDPTAMAVAGREAGRLADRLQQDASKFDEMGDRLSNVKVKMEEFWVVAAEKALPTLEKIAAVIEGINPGPLAAAAGNITAIFGTVAALKLAGKLDAVVAGWAAGNGVSAAGQTFAIKFLAPLTSGLSKILAPIAAIAIGYNIGLGIGNAIKEWRATPVNAARSGTATVTGVIENAGTIDSEASRVAALEKILAVQKEIVAARATEAGKIFSSTDALRLYDEQLINLRSMVEALNSDWAQHQMQINQAAAAAERLTVAVAALKKFESENLSLTQQRAKAQEALAAAQAEEARIIAEGNAARNIDAGALAAASLKAQQAGLALAKINEDLAQKAAEVSKAWQEQVALSEQIMQLELEQLPLVEQRTAAADKLRETEAKYYALFAGEKIDLKALGLADLERLKAKKDLLTIEDQLAQKVAESARNALEDQQRDLQERTAKLSADFTRTDAEKWAAQKQNLTESVAAAEAYLEKMREIRDGATTEEGKAQGDANVRGAQQDLGSAQSALGAIGPDPNSYPDQMISGITRMRESWGTAAQNMAQSFTGILNGAVSGTSDLLYGLASGSISFRQAWGHATQWVGQQFLRMATDMVSKMIWRATVERSLTALTVGMHVAGEQTKTAATLAGSGTRLLTIIKEALASVYHGAIEAFSAMASIPYVGPFLAAAAMATAIAGGIALVGKIGGHEKGGLVAGGKQMSWLNEGGTEFVFSAPAVRNLGPERLNALHEAAKGGDLSAFTEQARPAAAATASQTARGGVAAAPSQSPGGISRPDPEPRPVNVNVVVDKAQIRKIVYSREGDHHFVDAFNRTRHVLGL